jgi:hypothetical protein
LITATETFAASNCAAVSNWRQIGEAEKVFSSGDVRWSCSARSPAAWGKLSLHLENMSQRPPFDFRGIGLIRHKFPPEFGRHIPGAGQLIQGEGQNVVSSERAGFPQHLFHPGIVMMAIEDNACALVFRHAPAGEGPDRFFNVGLGVVAFAEREQFEQLAGEVLVRMVLVVGLGI